MNTCPSCSSAVSQEPPIRGAHLEHCHSCGVAWLDFSQHRPHLYAQLDKQIARWEARCRQELSAFDARRA
ncbi:MAG: hypothetical protein AB7I41_08155 [Candidatus Sericytochromatia bacterium]